MTAPDPSRVLVTQDVLESEVASLVDSAPETLDTLSELAAALGDDPNFATTVSTEIGLRAKTSDVNAALAGKADSGAETTATWAGVSGKPATFPPTIGTTASTAKAGNYAPAWSEVTGKPATFPPTTGTTAVTAKPGNYVPTWAEVTGKPTTFTPASHSHAWGEITGKPTAFTPSSHTHTVAQVTGLQAALDSKAATGHTHTKAQVGLGSVDNTSDAAKPVSTATQTAINAKIQLVSSFPASPVTGVLYLVAE